MEEEVNVLVAKTEEDREGCFEVRREVFIREQGVTNQVEFDGFDDHCDHVMATTPAPLASPRTDQVIATCRIRTVTPFVKIERLAVLKEWRGRNIGTKIMRKAIDVAERRHRGLVLVVHAQANVVPFYEKLGFIAVSDTHVEAATDIPHKSMMYVPQLKRAPDLLLWGNMKDCEEEFEQGDCMDPQVITNIRSVIRNFQGNRSPRVVHLELGLSVRVVGESMVRTYRECATALQGGQLARAEKLEGFVLSFAWEKLNTGHYSQVNDAWRELYTAVSACKALRLANLRSFQEALRSCDMGLVMGGDIDGESLSAFAWHLHSKLSPLPPLTFEKFSLEEPLPLANSQEIRRIERPSMEEFFEMFMKDEPVVITGVVSQWPAFAKWSFDYFNRMTGHRTVPIEIGSSYADDGWSQTLMTVNEFMKEFIEHKSDRGMGYLAQHRLFDQIPELLADIRVPDYCSFGSDGVENVDLNIWVGPMGTVSPLHTDPKSNIFCQVVGRKFLRLVPYTETAYVYANKEGFLTNTSQVDVERPDYSRFPKFANTHVYDCVLAPGECLFIPLAYWHHVRALDPSISVSCWFHAQQSQTGPAS